MDNRITYDPQLTYDDLDRIAPRIIRALRQYDHIGPDMETELLADIHLLRREIGPFQEAERIRRGRTPGQLFQRWSYPVVKIAFKIIVVLFVLGIIAIGGYGFIGFLDEQDRLYAIRNERFEKENLLSLQPTTMTYGWRVRYSSIDPSVEFKEVNDPKMNYVLVPDNRINLGNRLTADNPEIYFKEYRAISGDLRPMISIYPGGGVEERWLLRTSPDSNIDTRFVILEKPSERKEIYLTIQRTKASQSSYQIKVVEKAPTNR